MAKVVKWRCSEDHSHLYDEPVDGGYCPEDPPFHGFLERIEVEGQSLEITYPAEGQSFPEGELVTVTAVASDVKEPVDQVEFLVDGRVVGDAGAVPYACTFEAAGLGAHVLTARARQSGGGSFEAKRVTINVTKRSVVDEGPEVGLCVILLDASSSMTEPAFPNSPVTRLRLVATSAATGIFALERMQNNPHAFVAVFKFDDRVKLMFMDTIDNLIRRFGQDVRKFAEYLHTELFEMQGETDINQALREAHAFVDKFLTKRLPGFPLRRYTPLRQRILKAMSVESVSVPNVRVLLYTDGMQRDAQGNRELLPNPFTAQPLPGLDHDVVIGAFFGQETDEGCRELQSLLARCPRHDEPQFFLFNSPSHAGNLKELFRMASGASGFCPKCLAAKLN
jgi:hypothetical protein